MHSTLICIKRIKFCRLDENGEHCQSSMYRDLWANAPKEANLEYPDYTFEKHFGQPIPSYPPVPVVRDYLEGRWTKEAKQDLKKFIRFNTVVKHVRYQDEKDNFIVTVEDFKNGKTCTEIFSHVIVCTGIFCYPNTPEFPGTDKFEGRILHSHDFRSGEEFRGQRLLIIGSSYSATDISVNCLKFGAKHIIISYKSKPTGLPLPKGIEERPLVESFEEGKAFFKDGSSADVDTVMFCTGYKNHFPFLESRLRITEETSFYPPELYKGIVFTKGGNNKLFYIGAQNQVYSMTYFDIIASWITKYIMGQLPGEPVTKAKMEADIATWLHRLSTVNSYDDAIDFQAAVLKDLISSNGYSKEVLSAVPLFKDWVKHREEGIAVYRNHSFRSLITGTLSPKQTPFMEIFDDSIEAFLKHK